MIRQGSPRSYITTLPRELRQELKEYSSPVHIIFEHNPKRIVSTLIIEILFQTDMFGIFNSNLSVHDLRNINVFLRTNYQEILVLNLEPRLFLSVNREGKVIINNQISLSEEYSALLLDRLENLNRDLISTDYKTVIRKMY